MQSMAETSVDSPASAALDSDLLDTDRAGSAAIRGGAMRVGGYGLAILLSVGSSALLFRHLGVVDSGRYVTIVALVTLAGGITDAGLSAIGVRELATRDAPARASLMRSLSGLRLALTFAGIAAAVLFALLAGYAGTLVVGTLIAGAGLALQVLQDTYAITLTAQLRLGWVAAADLVRQTVMVAGIVALVIAGAGLLPFYAAAVPAGAAAVGLTAWLVRGSVPLLPSVHIAHWRGLLRETFAYAMATVVAAIYFRVAILIVSLIASGRQTGYFGVSFRVIEVLVVVPQLLVGATFPIFARAARDDRARLRYALGRTFDACLILGAGVGLALLVGAPLIIAVIAGPQFHPAETVLRIQGLALVASFTGAVWGYALLSLHRHRAVLVCSVVSLALTVALTAVLTEADGARGAAIGTAIGEALFSLMLGIAVFRGGVRPAVSWSAVPRVLLAALLGAATLAIPGIPDLVRVALALALYVGALLALRAIPQEVLEQLPNRLRPRSRLGA
jgi:O-antigen/teichoic acid export membrane protein